MARQEEIKEKIRLNYNSIPEGQKKVADYCVEHFDRIPFLNIHELAKFSRSSEASIVRYAQRIGYGGFKELQEEIASALQHRLEKNELFSIPAIENDVLSSVAQQDVKNINDTLNLIKRGTFDSAAKAIVSAHRVYTAGLGISYLLAEILSYQLNQIGIRSSNFYQGPSTFAEQILLMEQNDLLIVFSFPPYSEETIESAKLARERGFHVIAITNKENAPTTFYAQHSLIVKSENMLFTNSFAAISVLINALSTQCALKNTPAAEQRLYELNQLSNNTKLHLT